MTQRHLLLLLILFCGCNLRIDQNGISIVRPQTVHVETEPQHDPAQDVVIGNEFRMMILYDSANMAKLPLTQLNMITGRQVREFGQKYCVKGDGDSSDMRFLDYHDELSGVWATMRDRAKPESYPWLCLENGANHWEGPLPSDWQVLKTLLDKYAGVN